MPRQYGRYRFVSCLMAFAARFDLPNRAVLSRTRWRDQPTGTAALRTRRQGRRNRSGLHTDDVTDRLSCGALGDLLVLKVNA